MVQAATKAGRSLARDFGEVEKLQVSVKGPADFVSAADKRSEKILFEELSRARPGYSFLMEESGSIEGSDQSHRWIIDPLDGTTNFLHGNPNFCIAMALEREGRLAAALIYNPIFNELFTAERGAGAFLNDTRIRVAGRRHMNEALISVRLPSLARVKSAKRVFGELAALAPQVAGLRQSGSAALELAFVAAGRLDGVYAANLSAWDLAAGVLLIREAGGIVTDFDGKDTMLETGEIIAGNGEIQAHLRTALSGVKNSQAADEEKIAPTPH